jgi:hypothetical protein
MVRFINVVNEEQSQEGTFNDTRIGHSFGLTNLAEKACGYKTCVESLCSSLSPLAILSY